MENKTAVEWLIGQFDNIVELYPSEWEKINNAIQKAKEMEKEQIIKAFNYGNADTDLAYGSEYFKKTYKK